MILDEVNSKNLITILKTSYVGTTKISNRDRQVLTAIFSFADYGSNGFYGKAEYLESQVGSSSQLIQKSINKLKKLKVLQPGRNGGLFVFLEPKV